MDSLAYQGRVRANKHILFASDPLHANVVHQLNKSKVGFFRYGLCQFRCSAAANGPRMILEPLSRGVGDAYPLTLGARPVNLIHDCQPDRLDRKSVV